MFDTSDSQQYTQPRCLQQGCRTQLPVAGLTPSQDTSQLMDLSGLSNLGHLHPVWLDLSCAHRCVNVHITQSYSFPLTFPLTSSGLFSLSCQSDVDELQAEVQVSGTLMFRCSACCCLFLLLQENPCLTEKEYLFLLCCKACCKFQIQTANGDLMLIFLKCPFCAFFPFIVVIPSPFLSSIILSRLS